MTALPIRFAARGNRIVDLAAVVAISHDCGYGSATITFSFGGGSVFQMQITASEENEVTEEARADVERQCSNIVHAWKIARGADSHLSC